MKAGMLFTGSGPLVILTEHDSLTHPDVIDRLRVKGVDKFIAHELPLDQVRERYGRHFDAIMHDLRQTDELRVLDDDGRHAFRLISLRDLGEPIMHEGMPISRPAMT